MVPRGFQSRATVIAGQAEDSAPATPSSILTDRKDLSGTPEAEHWESLQWPCQPSVSINLGASKAPSQAVPRECRARRENGVR